MTLEELQAIEHADERAMKCQEALDRARAFDREVTLLRDEALRAMRAAGSTYGQIATLTGVNRSTVVSATRSVRLPTAANDVVDELALDGSD